MLPKPFAFVLMPFSEAFRDTYLLGIKPSCEEAGYYCERLDEQIFEETMLERVYNQIAKADLVIADLTERNPNVFYETGYAHALGKRVILLTRNAEDIPFDLKHHFHIIYSSGIAELKSRLRERVAYYLQHPNTNTRNPFDQLSLLINGQPINWAFKNCSLNAPLKYSRGDDGPNFVVRIDTSLHLLDNATDTDLTVDMRLITTNMFSESGWELGAGASQLYTSIAMPDGRTLHKPLDSIRVSFGDPDKVVFDLRPKAVLNVGISFPMTLRLLSSGLRHEIQLNVTIAKE